MPTVSSHSIVTKDAIGPDAVSRNHSRAAPRSTSAVMTCRKKASIRTSMKRGEDRESGGGALRVAMLSVHTCPLAALGGKETGGMNRSEEHTSELQSRLHL